MGKKFTKKEAVAIAISASRAYQDHFVGRQVLFLMTDKHRHVFSLEVSFDASNFHHLTGLTLTDKSWSHLDFYTRCVSGGLRESDIGFAPNGTTHQKLYVLPYVFKSANLSASMMGTYNHSHPLLYTEKLVGGIKWALGFRDVTGRGDYVPDTLLEGDIRDQVQQTFRIIATYTKMADEAQFTNCVYRAKKINYDRLVYPDDWGSKPKV